MFALIMTGFVVLAGSMFWAFTKSASTSSLQEGDSRVYVPDLQLSLPDGREPRSGVKVGLREPHA
jgi:hypothetical protein